MWPCVSIGVFYESTLLQFLVVSICMIDIYSFKGQLISKTNRQTMDSPKKRTNEFVFTSMRRVFVRFLGESLGLTICFRNYLTFKNRKFGKDPKSDRNWLKRNIRDIRQHPTAFNGIPQ